MAGTPPTSRNAASDKQRTVWVNVITPVLYLVPLYATISKDPIWDSLCSIKQGVPWTEQIEMEIRSISTHKAGKSFRLRDFNSIILGV